MYGKATTKSTFVNLIEVVTSFVQIIKSREVDKCIKKFTLFNFIFLMNLTQLTQLKSLFDISRKLDNEKLAELLYLTSISAAQISRNLKEDLLGAIQVLFTEIIHQADNIKVFKDPGKN